MQSKRWGVYIACGMVMVLVFMSVIHPVAWAAPENAPVGQTVPTRTPTLAPVTPSPQPTSVKSSPQPTSSSGVPTNVPDSTAETEATPVLLPVAGDDVDGSLTLLGWLGLSFIGLAWFIRRKMMRAVEE